MPRTKVIKMVFSAIDRTGRVLKSIIGGLKKWGSSVLKITGAVIVGVGGVTAAFGLMFKKLSEQIDEQAKVASSLGLQNEALACFVMRPDTRGFLPRT